MNLRGIIDSNSTIFNFLLPGIIASLFSAVFQAIDHSDINPYIYNRDYSRTSYGQAGFQLIGLCITIAIAGVAGLIIGVFYRFVNRF
jgi:hypothetical protein